MFLKKRGSGNSRRRSGNRNRMVVVGMFMFRLVKRPRFIPAKALLGRVGAKVASALRFESIRRSCRHKVSSSNLPRPRSLTKSTESHHAEAIEDCIQFLNTSSSLSRSNSVSTCSS
ncbi:hypothetical protein ES332_D04G160500v1 [Gossypium tomentosum]|uniref:Josephin-like protein n=1 Tax=Gossypium tomentosum TaxID=34277 RepID=A0A5D2LDU9_GOSTO|nr:hypothetical protein ES332_D04G160500v1 [Gossypium tomentosum]